MKICGTFPSYSSLLSLFPPVDFEVCRYLIVNGERQDEDSLGGRKRTETLRMLVAMNPTQALPVRALTVRIKNKIEKIIIRKWRNGERYKVNLYF